MKPTATIALFSACALTAALGCADSQSSAADTNTPDAPTLGGPANTGQEGGAQAMQADTPPALDFELPAIDGTPVQLADYHGRVVLIVNTASECGLTPQYEQLQALHERYADDGLAVLGFPANNFGAQEPGSNDQIAAFCTQNYGVGFPMFAKLSVQGDDQHPLYAYLTSEETNPEYAGDIAWNFEKFLLNRDGQVVARFAPQTRPDAPEVIAAIEAELNEAAP